jgi:hypothetical protein
MTIIKSNKALLQNLMKQLHYKYDSSSLKQLINDTGNYLNELSDYINLSEFIDASLNSGELSEILFMSYLDGCNLPYLVINQDQFNFYSNFIRRNTQRPDLICKGYNIDVKCNKLFKKKFTINSKVFSDYKFYVNNIANLYLVYFNKDEMLRSSNIKTVSILNFSDLIEAVKLNQCEFNLFRNYYYIPNNLLTIVKVTELQNYFV